MKLFCIEWFESKTAVLEVENEAEARQWWMDGPESIEAEVFNAEIIDVYEVDEKGERA